jgi:L-rhamnose mutarotase
VKLNEPTLLLALDLKDDSQLIVEYKRHHERVWPEVTAGLKRSGVQDAEIYLLGTRLFMILEVDDNFSLEAKTKADREDGKEWLGNSAAVLPFVRMMPTLLRLLKDSAILHHKIDFFQRIDVGQRIA